MADEKDTAAPVDAKAPDAPKIPVVPEPKQVEVTMQPEKPAANPVKAPSQDDMCHLTPVIMQALCFDTSSISEQELRAHNSQLKNLLGKVIELLKEKSGLCSNLEKQNNALMLQCNSLKDVVAITKDLLSIRNMEVEHLHVDIKSMEEKINLERERHNNMLNRMSEAVKLNDSLKREYQSQLGLFTDLRARYEEKVAILEAENKRVLELLSKKPVAEPAGEGEGEGDVQLSLEEISPP